MNIRSKEEMVHEFRIQTIQDATTKVIARKGMANATMQDIADEAGIAKGTIYLYFSDREDLVEKTFGFAIGRLHAKLEEALATPGDFTDRLHLLIRSKVEFFDENREFFRIYMSLRLPSGPVERKQRRDDHCGGLYEEHIESVTRLIRNAVDAGVAKKIDARRLALFLVEGTNALIIQRLSEEPPRFSSEDEAEKIVDTLLHGVLAPRKGVKR